jgi:hypothetical protein
MGDQPDGGEAGGQARYGERGGQAFADEGKKDRDESGEEAGECGGESHCAHGQGAVEDGQRDSTFKAADAGVDERCRGGKRQVHGAADGEEDEQGEEVAGDDDQ